MQSMTYLKRMGPIANSFIVLSQVVFLLICIRPKKRDGFYMKFKFLKNLSRFLAKYK